MAFYRIFTIHRETCSQTMSNCTLSRESFLKKPRHVEGTLQKRFIKNRKSQIKTARDPSIQLKKSKNVPVLRATAKIIAAIRTHPPTKTENLNTTEI